MLRQSLYVKISVGVPLPAADAVREAMGAAGAGKQGSYEYCSFTARGVGRFRPLAGARPAIGVVGKLQAVEEVVLETICHRDLAPGVIAAIKAAHPYEEPAIDIMPRFELE